MLKLIKLIIIVGIISFIAYLVFGIALVKLAVHPEVIGEFFGKIVNGFKSVVK